MSESPLVSQEPGTDALQEVLTSVDSPPRQPVIITNKNSSNASPSDADISLDATPKKTSRSGAFSTSSTPDVTPKKYKRTFVFSSAFRPPMSRRTINYTGAGLDSSQLASHAFDPPAATYNYRDRIQAPFYADCYYRSLQTLPTPSSCASTDPDLDDPSWFINEPELSVGCDTTEDSKSSELLGTPDDIRTRFKQTDVWVEEQVFLKSSLLCDSPALFQQRSPILTPPLRRQHRSSPDLLLAAFSEVDLPDARVQVYKNILPHITSADLKPPTGTFRSSHACRLRSESFAEARQHAKVVRELKEFKSFKNSTPEVIQDTAYKNISVSGIHNKNGNSFRNTKRNNENDCAIDDEDSEDSIILGISELDIFGAGLMAQNLNRHTSTPWRRSDRAPPIFRRKRFSFDEELASNLKTDEKEHF